MIPAVVSQESKSQLALLVRMKDGREYLVPQECLSQLIEFSKTFDAKIHRVKVENPGVKVMELSKLPIALCDAGYDAKATYVDLGCIVPLGTPTIEHEVSLATSPTLRERCREVREEVSEQLLGGAVVTIQNFYLQNTDIPRPVFMSAMAHMRGKLRKEGHKVERVSAGVYRIPSEANEDMLGVGDLLDPADDDEIPPDPTNGIIINTTNNPFQFIDDTFVVEL